MPGILQDVYLPVGIGGCPGFDGAHVLLADADAPGDTADTSIAPDTYYEDMLGSIQQINGNLMVAIVCIGVLFGSLLAQSFSFWKW